MEKYYLHLDGGQKGPFTIGKGVLGPRTRDARGDERAFAHEPLLLHEQRADSLEDALPQLGRFEPVAELQKRGGVGPSAPSHVSIFPHCG